MAEPEYQRLTRAKPRRSVAVVFHTRSSLWLGSDHLLCVDYTGFAETYKRFFFRDIQAVTLRRTRRRLVWNIVLGLLTAVAAAVVGYAVSLAEYGLAAGLSSLLLLFGIPLIMNNVLGPTCACQVRTAVQIEDLPSLNRIRQSHRIIARVRPLIAAAQGLLSPEEVSERMRQLVQAPAQPGVPEAQRIDSAPDPNAPPVIT